MLRGKRAVPVEKVLASAGYATPAPGKKAVLGHGPQPSPRAAELLAGVLPRTPHRCSHGTLSFPVLSPSGFSIWVMLASQNMFQVFRTLQLSGDV